MRRRSTSIAVLLLVPLLGAGVGRVGAEPPEPRHDPSEVRRQADEILAGDEFQPPSETILDRISRWLGDLFEGDSGQVEAGATGSGGSGVLTVVLLVAAVAALALVVRVLVLAPRRARRPADPEPEVEVERVRSVDEWTVAALRHESVGEWKDGLRCRFRALVGRLTERGLVPEVPGRTSGELRADVRATAPAAGADFDQAADLFDRAWYGDLPTGPDEAREFADHADRVLAAGSGER